jgi:hypothetical protein
MAGAAAALSLSACAMSDGAATPPSTGSASAEAIGYEVGPCFGFCPVYSASISAAGQVRFDGIRHTATFGPQSLVKDARTYRAFAAALAAYRPASGTTASTSCDTRMSDQQHYRITWTSADGSQTVLEHDRGCRSARNDQLNALLDKAPAQLGIAALAKQTTRPGASRG